MDGKVLLVLIGIINYSLGAGLLKKPKIYNAVITTDENLTPSRAIPVIQPTIHETGIASYPFGPFAPYQFYNQIVPFGQPGLYARPESVPIPQQHPNELLFGPNPTAPAEMPLEVQMDDNSPRKTNPMTRMPEERVPIPLNQFGLPPSLIPLQNFPQHPVNLQPYPYNHYPLIYDHYNQYHDHLLPPYGYYPPYSFGIRHSTENTSKPQGKTEHHSPGKDSAENKKTSDEKDNFDDIKNGTTNQNSEVPDVPPPPLPSGAKTSK